MSLEHKSGIWIPGEPLSVELTSPTPAELREHFAATLQIPDSEVISLPGSLSALQKPEHPPTGYAFIDLDDFVIDLSGSLQELENPNPTPTQDRSNNHDYGENLFFEDSDVELKHALFGLIKASGRGARPAPNLSDITYLMQSWRAQGIYTGFLAAATKGSEIPTVDNILGKYFKDSCDFLVITSGNDYRVADKGAAALEVVQEFGYDQYTPVVFLDDWPDHTRKFRSAFAGMPNCAHIRTFQHAFQTHKEADTGSAQAKSALGAMVQATRFLRGLDQ